MRLIAGCLERFLKGPKPFGFGALADMPQRIVSPAFSATKGIPLLFSWNFEVVSFLRCLPFARIEGHVSILFVSPIIHDYVDSTDLIDKHGFTR